MSAPAHPASPQQGPALTIEDWARLPEDEPGELFKGHLEDEEVADPAHELAVTWFISVLRAWLRGRGGFVFGSDLKLALSDDLGRKPDLSVYLPGGHVPGRRGMVHVPPDIAVEVVSPSARDERRDRVEKMSEYAAFGIRLYWLFDPRLGCLEVFELGTDGRYARAMAVTTGTLTGVPGCPDLELDLDELWADLERLGPDEDPAPPR